MENKSWGKPLEERNVKSPPKKFKYQIMFWQYVFNGKIEQQSNLLHEKVQEPILSPRGKR